MNRNINIPDQPTASPARLQEALLQLVDQLDDGATAKLVRGVPLASGVNKMQHGLKQAPRAISFAPYSNVAWHVPTRPDETYVHITAAGAVTGDLFIWP